MKILHLAIGITYAGIMFFILTVDSSLSFNLAIVGISLVVVEASLFLSTSQTESGRLENIISMSTYLAGLIFSGLLALELAKYTSINIFNIKYNIPTTIVSSILFILTISMLITLVVRFYALLTKKYRR